MPKVLSPGQIDAFNRDGFVAPVRAISEQRALYYRNMLEAFEARYPNDRIKLDQKAHMICPWIDEMIREPGVLDATEDLIGPDILCWGTSLRAKQPDGKTFAGWHQDTAYADVKPIVVIVALALSPARTENGCIRGIPGSHRGPLLPHKEAFATNSLLSREQFIDVTSLTEKKEIQLTRGTDNVGSPRWSPSGETIAYMSSRALPKPKPDSAPMQLWLLNTSGGEPWPVTETERGIQQFEWLDNDTILFSAEEDSTLYERNMKESKDDSDAVDDEAHAAPVRLFKLSVKDKKVTRLTDNTDWIEGFEPSKDGKKAVAVARHELSYAWDEKVPPVTYIVDLTTGQRTQIFPGRKILPGRIRWARDNSGFYVTAPFSDSPRFYTASIEKLYYYDLASGTATEVNLDWERSIGYNLEVTNDGVVALMNDGVYTKPARYTRHGNSWTREWITGDTDKNYFDFILGDDDHTLLYEYSTASIPTQWYRARLDGSKVTAPVQITDLNPQYKNKTIAKTEVLHWKGANGDDVEGILFYPFNYESGKKYPLVSRRSMAARRAPTTTRGARAGHIRRSCSISAARSS